MARDDYDRAKVAKWPETLPRPGSPTEWQPSARQESYNFTGIIYIPDGAPPEQENEWRNASLYRVWLSERYVLDIDATEHLEDQLFSVSKKSRDLRDVVYSPGVWTKDDMLKSGRGVFSLNHLRGENEGSSENLDAFAREFETFYLGLLPDAEERPDDPVLVIEGLHLASGFEDDAKYLQLRNGGRIPLAAIAGTFDMEPEAFRKHLIERACRSEAQDAQSMHPVFIRADNYLFKVLPLEDDSDYVAVGRVYVLSHQGIQALEGLLEAYEAGMQHIGSD